MGGCVSSWGSPCLVVKKASAFGVDFFNFSQVRMENSSGFISIVRSDLCTEKVYLKNHFLYQYMQVLGY